MSREARRRVGRSTSLGFGSVIHALADHMSREDTADEARLLSLLDCVWDQLHFESPWIADRERVEAQDAIRRFVAWADGRPGREFLGSEQDFQVEVRLEGGEKVAIRGKVDRVERDAEGGIRVVDFKTEQERTVGYVVARQPAAGPLPACRRARGSCGAVRSPTRGPAARSWCSYASTRPDVPRCRSRVRSRLMRLDANPIEIQLIGAVDTVRSETFDAQGQRLLHAL
ncbi:MAG: PD-(D/E)XK nuclease family protein [Nocardioidaceae bacterium]